ncbi:MAG: molybdenum cofactor biosynthesis protein MoaE [Deltaproteobacteria bacterium]|nr:molybdenum cofactor biosynthesis protein MoaE [Deltaproteobacteria bacterium]
MAAHHAKLSAEPIDVTALMRAVVQPKDGAVILFVGVVRNRNDGRDVVAVSYDAFVPLAERTLAAIAAETPAEVSVAVEHRTGRLAVGEASVAIAVAAPHRVEAYEASRYVIEQIKRRLPVWKQEHYVDGDSEWLDGCCLHSSDGSDHDHAPEPRL